MLRDKDIKKIEEIQTDFNPENFDVEKIMSIFKAMQLRDSLSEFNHLKRSGYSFKLVLSLLIVMVVMANKTVSSFPARRNVLHFVELKASVHACYKTKFCKQTNEL